MLSLNCYTSLGITLPLGFLLYEIDVVIVQTTLECLGRNLHLKIS